MFHLNAFEFEVMGHSATFDVVTAYGLICAAVFLTGFAAAIRFEGRRNSQTDARSERRQP